MPDISEPVATLELQVFQHYAGSLMGVFRVSDPRPEKASAYSAAMPVLEAIECALYVAQSKSIDIMIDDPHGRLFSLAA